MISSVPTKTVVVDVSEKSAKERAGGWASRKGPVLWGEELRYECVDTPCYIRWAREKCVQVNGEGPVLKLRGKGIEEGWKEATLAVSARAFFLNQCYKLAPTEQTPCSNAVQKIWQIFRLHGIYSPKVSNEQPLQDVKKLVDQCKDAEGSQAALELEKCLGDIRVVEKALP